MTTDVLKPPEFNTPALLEALFERSRDGFFFMMLDEPGRWDERVDKEAALDYVFVQGPTKGLPNPRIWSGWRLAILSHGTKGRQTMRLPQDHEWRWHRCSILGCGAGPLRTRRHFG